MVDVIDGEPTGPNASRWASELGTRIRSYLDVTKFNFIGQDPRNVDLVIQQMGKKLRLLVVGFLLNITSIE